MKMFRIDVEWRLESGKIDLFGRSTIDVSATDIVSAINRAIRWCDNVPKKEIEDNGYIVDSNDTTCVNRIIRVFILGGK